MKDQRNNRRYPSEEPKEDFFDDWHPHEETPQSADPRQMSPEERERYYAQKDAYYARRDAWYAKRDAYYADRGFPDDGEPDDYEEFEEPDDEEPQDVPVRETPRRKKRRRKRKRHFFRRLVGFLLLAGLLLLLWGAPPDAGRTGEARTSGRRNILLAGLDEDGYRTDTLMLLSLDRAGRSLRLLSIPRDTYAPDYVTPKINSAYGAGGMAELLRQVEKQLGFPPDAYVLVDIDCFVQAVDLLGGLDFDVPQDMDYADSLQDLHIDLKAGYQHLNGEQVMGLVRFRSGYATADIGRTAVQREFLKAALDQWVRPEKIGCLPELWKLYRERVDTDLSVRNLLWIARVLLKADVSAMQTDVLPGWADMAGGYSVYMIERSSADQLLKEYDPWG